MGGMPYSMADRFSQAVKAVLARRVADRCSNPVCRAVTSGPGLRPEDFSNVGVAAHITAASPGGPRYDPTLTPQERASAINGIWLCGTCAHLVDTDEENYPVDLLRRWKAEAEDRAAKMLLAGVGSISETVELSMPVQESADSLLSFANTAIARIGRDDELEKLRAFLDTDRPFAWWLWTGPAGVGKSRLAIELCRQVSGTWKAGFLSQASQSGLADLRPVVPTLVVVDYAAQRSEWLSDALYRLSQYDRGAPVRVLVLERSAAGPWWNAVRRLHRMEESFQVAAAMYGLPEPLGGLSRAELGTLITEVATQAGVELSSTNLEDIADHAEQIDPDGRPLFALIATLDWLDDNGASGGRDGALRRLLSRMDEQTAERLAGGPLSLPVVRNLRTLATALGGTSVADYDRLLQMLRPRASLLPELTDDFRTFPLEELLEGVKPDILSELYVLDRLAAGDVEHAIVVELLRLAWQASQEAYHAFVERTAGDHVEHERLVDLLDAADWQHSPVASAQLLADIVPQLQRSDHPALDWIFSRLRAIQEASREPVDETIVTARFHFANLVLREGNFGLANQLYSDALAHSDPSWPVHANILNNRGITWQGLGNRDAAYADYTTVIESTVASNEARACALNNRADLHDEDDELDSAIADRTAVIALVDTTYDRRFIALARRARARWKLGDQAAANLANQDIEAILATADIAVEQKMNARLLRARHAISAGRSADALADLEAVIASNRNFDAVEQSARELIAGL
jgi:tetratricopeptide (TPR) repeat protein